MRAEALKGHLDLLLLAVMEDGPTHGYAVIEELRQRTGDAFDLPEGTVYPALHRLERAGLLESRWAEAPELTALQAVPVKAITAATAAAPACGALPRHEPAARHETALSPIAQLRPSGSHYHVRPLPLPALTYPCCLLPPSSSQAPNPRWVAAVSRADRHAADRHIHVLIVSGSLISFEVTHSARED